MRPEIQTQIPALVSQLEGEDIEQLQAGLAVLARDMDNVLRESQIDGDKFFSHIYNSALEHSSRGNQLINPPEELPSGFAKDAAQGYPNIAPLTDPDIRHEWTIYPGEEIFDQTSSHFSESICGSDGLYEKFRRGEIGQADLPVLLAVGLLTNGLAPKTFWVPYAVYVSMILVNKGFEEVCSQLNAQEKRSVQEIHIDWDQVDIYPRVDHLSEELEEQFDQFKYRLRDMERKIFEAERDRKDNKQEIDHILDTITEIQDEIERIDDSTSSKEEMLRNHETVERELEQLRDDLRSVRSEMEELEVNTHEQIRRNRAQIEDIRKKMIERKQGLLSRFF